MGKMGKLGNKAFPSTMTDSIIFASFIKFYYGFENFKNSSTYTKVGES